MKLIVLLALVAVASVAVSAHKTHKIAPTIGVKKDLDSGLAVCLDTSKATINLPTTNFGGDLSMEMWVYPTTYSNAELLSFKSTTTSIVWSLASNGRMAYSVNGGSKAVSTVTVPKNVWTHVSVTHNRDQSVVFTVSFVQQKATQTIALPVVALRSVSKIGYGFVGRVDEARVFSEAKSNDEIIAYANDIVNNVGGLYASWSFDAGVGGIALDTASTYNPALEDSLPVHGFFKDGAYSCAQRVPKTKPCNSGGDPHISGFDRCGTLHYQKQGDFWDIKLPEPHRQKFGVQSRHKHCNRRASCNYEVAVVVHGNVYRFDRKTLYKNNVPYTSNTVNVVEKNGATVTRASNYIKINVPDYGYIYYSGWNFNAIVSSAPGLDNYPALEGLCGNWNGDCTYERGTNWDTTQVTAEESFFKYTSTRDPILTLSGTVDGGDEPENTPEMLTKINTCCGKLDADDHDDCKFDCKMARSDTPCGGWHDLKQTRCKRRNNVKFHECAKTTSTTCKAEFDARALKCTKPCPNGCSNQGTCSDAGICTCDATFTSADCSLPVKYQRGMGVAPSNPAVNAVQRTMIPIAADAKSDFQVADAITVFLVGNDLKIAIDDAYDSTLGKLALTFDATSTATFANGFTKTGEATTVSGTAVGSKINFDWKLKEAPTATLKGMSAGCAVFTVDSSSGLKEIVFGSANGALVDLKVTEPLGTDGTGSFQVCLAEADDSCMAITSCSDCEASSVCGWCETTKSCEAGDARGAHRVSCATWRFTNANANKVAFTSFGYPVSPASVTVVAPLAAPLSVPVGVDVSDFESPNVPVDILLVEQSTKVSFLDDLKWVGEQFAAVKALISLEYPGVNFGLASFSDFPTAPHGVTGDSDFKMLAKVGSSNADIAAGFNRVKFTNGGDATNAQLSTLMKAATSAAGTVGWRSDRGRVVVISTDTLPRLTGAGIPTIAALRTALHKAYIIPMFLSTKEVKQSYDDIIAELGFGVSLTLASDSSDIISALTVGLFEAFHTVNMVVLSDASNSIEKIEPAMLRGVSAGSRVVFNVFVKNAGDASAATLAVPGYGAATVNTVSTDTPTAVARTLLTDEGVELAINLAGSSSYGDADKFFTIIEDLSTLSAMGDFYVGAGNTIANTTKIARANFVVPSPASQIIFVPTAGMNDNVVSAVPVSFTYTMSDGCRASAAVAVKVAVRPVNSLPVAFTTDVTTLVNEGGNSASIAITAQDADLEFVAGTVKFFVTAIRDVTGAGGQYRNNVGAVLAVGDEVPTTANEATSVTYNSVGVVMTGITARVVNAITVAPCDSATNCAANNYGTAVTSKASVTPMNDAPIAFAQTVSGRKAFHAQNYFGAIVINLQASDPSLDFDGAASFTINSLSLGTGLLYQCAATGAQEVDNNSGLYQNAAGNTNKGALISNGDTVSVVSFTGKSASACVLYIGSDNLFGSDSFTFTVNDQETRLTPNNLASPAVTVSVDIKNTDYPPIAGVPAAVTTAEDTELIFSINAVAGNLDDTSDTADNSLAGKITEIPTFMTSKLYQVGAGDVKGAVIAVGDIVTNVDGKVIYVPTPDAFSHATHEFASAAVYLDSFSYVLADSLTAFTESATETLTSNTITVNIPVTPVNDKPVAIAATEATDEDVPLALSFASRATDIDHNVDTVGEVLVSVAQPTNGVLYSTYVAADDLDNVVASAAYVNLDTVFVFVPAQDYFSALVPAEVAAFTFTARDAAGAVSDPAVLTITVLPINDAPSADMNDVVGLEDNNVAFMLGSSDTEGDAVTYVITSLPTQGTLFADSSCNSAVGLSDIAVAGGDNVNGQVIVGGALCFRADANEFGPQYAKFSYLVVDTPAAPNQVGAPLRSEERDVFITIDPVNDQPIAGVSEAFFNPNYFTSEERIADAAALEFVMEGASYITVNFPGVDIEETANVALATNSSGGGPLVATVTNILTDQIAGGVLTLSGLPDGSFSDNNIIVSDDGVLPGRVCFFETPANPPAAGITQTIATITYTLTDEGGFVSAPVDITITINWVPVTPNPTTPPPSPTPAPTTTAPTPPPPATGFLSDNGSVMIFEDVVSVMPLYMLNPSRLTDVIVTITSLPNNGTLSFDGAVITAAPFNLAMESVEVDGVFYAFAEVVYTPALNGHSIDGGNFDTFIWVGESPTAPAVVTAVESVSIVVRAVNDAPTVDAPATASIDANTPLTIPVVVGDVDMENDADTFVTAVVKTTAGAVLTVAPPGAAKGSSLVITAPGAEVTITGHVLLVDQALRQLSFTSDAGGRYEVTVSVSDNGFTGQDPENLDAITVEVPSQPLVTERVIVVDVTEPTSTVTIAVAATVVCGVFAAALVYQKARSGQPEVSPWEEEDSLLAAADENPLYSDQFAKGSNALYETPTAV